MKNKAIDELKTLEHITQKKISDEVDNGNLEEARDLLNELKGIVKCILIVEEML